MVVNGGKLRNVGDYDWSHKSDSTPGANCSTEVDWLTFKWPRLPGFSPEILVDGSTELEGDNMGELSN